MKTYLFVTTTTVKPIDKDKWWIDRDLISNIYIQSNNLDEALRKYQERIQENYGVTISDHAIKNKSPMFIDDNGNPIQIGYVITGKTPFHKNGEGWIDKYIDLWIEIQEIKNPFIKEEVL